MKNDERILKAQSILHSLGLNACKYLGSGRQGVVYNQNGWIYKVILSEKTELGDIIWYRNYFKNHNFKTDHFCNLAEVIHVDKEITVEKYKYEKGEQISIYTESESIIFLATCWREKVVVFDCKPENFIRVNNKLKMIDMGACSSYSDNLFLNSCLRMFIYSHYWNSPLLKKIQRSSINNLDLPEFSGFSVFLTKVFNQIIYQESEETYSKYQTKAKKELVYEKYNMSSLPNLENLFFSKIKENLYLCDVQVDEIRLSSDGITLDGTVYIGYKKIKKCAQNVSLLIKTCAMDVATIEQVTKHIVRQLVYPETFKEVILSIDSKKDNFLRQYTDNSDYDKVIGIAERLKKEKIIDRIVIFNADEALRINKEWFNLKSSETHSVKNVPIASQLYAFEQCQGDYIFQMDSDVMIGRKDLDHNYLQDMLAEFDKNEKVVSVGFNIYNKESKEYFGFENGGFVPEVRMGLFHKERFFNLRPLPNSLAENGKLNLSWYRSMEIHQKNTGYCSIRGGNNEAFFVHPQNYRKSNAYSWMNILDRVEQLEIPCEQYGNFDCAGSFYDWCRPKRKENLIVVVCVSNTNPESFFRFWASLISQDLQDFGIVLYDNCSENGISIFIQNLIVPYKDRITFIKGRNKLADLQCEFIAIRNVCVNQQSVIVCADANSAFVGNTVLSYLCEKYNSGYCDLTCGCAYETGKLKTNYTLPVNFLNPRSETSNVWNGLISFKKYLFDSIPLNHFIYDDCSLKISQRKWYENHKEMVKMIPMVEMSSSPLQLWSINYFVESRESKSSENNEDVGTELKNKKQLEISDLIFERKAFVTNKDRIDIDITFLCNLNCKGCIRSCGEAPSSERMSLEDIKNFIDESIRLNKKWQRLNILGGEPTLHPDFLKILEMLQTDYADAFHPNVDIQVVSNGKLEKSRELCKEAEKFKNVRIDYNSYKTDRIIDFFTPFNDAPCDDSAFKDSDFSKACWVAADSGFGLNKNGYFACPNCSGIDRVLNLGMGLKSFEDLTDEIMKKQFKTCCKFCGFFKHYSSNLGYFIPRNQRSPFKDIVSDSWKKIYEAYNARR